MVGNDLEMDIQPAIRLGLHGVWVASATERAEKPWFKGDVVASLAELVERQIPEQS